MKNPTSDIQDKDLTVSMEDVSFDQLQEKSKKPQPKRVEQKPQVRIPKKGEVKDESAVMMEDVSFEDLQKSNGEIEQPKEPTIEASHKLPTTELPAKKDTENQLIDSVLALDDNLKNKIVKSLTKETEKEEVPKIKEIEIPIITTPKITLPSENEVDNDLDSIKDMLQEIDSRITSSASGEGKNTSNTSDRILGGLDLDSKSEETTEDKIKDAPTLSEISQGLVKETQEKIKQQTNEKSLSDLSSVIGKPMESSLVAKNTESDLSDDKNKPPRRIRLKHQTNEKKNEIAEKPRTSIVEIFKKIKKDSTNK